VPAAAALVYVQQPERALWNLHFVAVPAAVTALEVLPGSALALFLAACGGVGLRFGAQLPIQFAARASLGIAVAMAIAAAVLAARRPRTEPLRPPR